MHSPRGLIWPSWGTASQTPDGRLLIALLVINRLNLMAQRTLPSTNPLAAFFYDTNRDGLVSPIDALLVINRLNNRSGVGEGEQAAQRKTCEDFDE